MKRLFTYILLCLCCTSLSATVKPRDGRQEPLVFADQEEETDSHGHADNGRLMSPWKIGSQSNAPLKAKGSPKVPVILVQFIDKRFTTGLGVTNGVRNQCFTEEDEIVVNEAYNKFCNGVPDSDYYTGLGSHGAITEYFRDQSNGQFTPEFVVIGPVTLDDDYAFYGKDGSRGKDINLSLFYSDAIKAAQKVYSNWGDFDNDNNIVAFRRYHNSLLAIPATHDGETVTPIHSHLTNNPYITPTDICNYLLYARDVHGIKSFIVYSPKLKSRFVYMDETKSIITVTDEDKSKKKDKKKDKKSNKKQP